MRKITRQVLSVVMVFAVVTTGCIVAINLNQTPAEEYSPVGESEAVVVSGTAAVGLALATTAGAGLVCIEMGHCFDDHEDIDGAEVAQLHSDMYSIASASAEKQRVLDQSLDNYLNETKTLARLHAINALVRGHADGNLSSKYEAEQAAEDEALDYYSVKMVQVLNSYEGSVHAMYRIQDRVSNESDLDPETVYNVTNRDPDDAFTTESGVADAFNDGSRGTADVVLPNGSAYNIDTHYVGTFGKVKLTDKTRPVYNATVAVEPPSSTDQAPVDLIDYSEYMDQIKDIQAQASEVRSGVGTVANQTWADIDSGAINETALVDPYLGAREYSPGTGTWSRRMLTSIGVEAPRDLATYGNMTIRTGGQNYTGILMSDSHPGGGFSIGETYDTANITGAQYIVTPDGNRLQLEGQFSIPSAKYSNGTQVPDDHSFTYPDVDQDVSNLDDFKEIIKALDEYRSEEVARERRGEESSGGFLPEGVPPWAAVVIAGVAVALWVDRRDNTPTIIER